MNLFQLGDFTLNSGAKSRWKIECDSLTDDDVQALAHMIAQAAGCFSEVEGVPRGGLGLANALQKYCIIPHEDHEPKPYPRLIVDDVLTTGGSMERLKEDRVMAHGWIPSQIVGVVLFARGPCPPWVKALFQLPEELWLQSGRAGHAARR